MGSTVNEQHDALADFIDEALESLRGLPSHLDAYRATPTAEPINAVFRAVHSIKGCAAFLGLDAIRAFSHTLENTLDVIRTESTPLNDALQHRLLEAFDRLDALLQEAAGGKIASELLAEDTCILESVKAAAPNPRDGQSAEVAFLAAIRRFAEQMASGSKDVRQLSQELRSLVQDYASRSTLQQPASGAAAKLSPADCRECHFTCAEVDVTDRVAGLLQFFVDFAEGCNSPDRERAFLQTLDGFATWANQNGAADLEQALQSAAADFRIVHESPLDFDDNLISLIWDHLAPALAKLRTVERQEEAAREKTDAAPTGPHATAAKTAAPEPAAKSRFVRVKEEHLDQFLEHVSRMFITSERFRDVQSRMAETGQLPQLADELRQINMDLKVESTALQQGVMALRRVSIASLFAKFPRMARTLASQLGKQVHVHQCGEETEIDKQLSEDLDAPLTQATLVIDGLMVAAGSEPFVIPFENIKEIVRVDSREFKSVGGRPVLTIRNSTYDAVHLGEITGARHKQSLMTDAQTVVVVQCKRGSLCVRVDQVVGHRQVVVTALNEVLPDTTKLTGIAQLGGGRLAPVLNIPEIVKTLA